jgi:hypothetical protein
LLLSVKDKKAITKKYHMKQAISYAREDSIQADFCVFTDGNTWQIKRKKAAGWFN